MTVRSPPLDRVFRFFCGRRGAATARALITAWTFVGVPLGGAIVWIGNQAVAEFRDLKEAVRELQLYVAADTVRGDTRDRALAAAISSVIETKNEMAGRIGRAEADLADHDRRIIRLEVRVERPRP